MPVSFYKWITEKFVLSQKLSIVINLLETSIFQALGTLFTFGFTGLVQKQFRIYLSHTQAFQILLHDSHLLHCSPLQIFLPLPKTYSIWPLNKAEIFASCFYKPRQFYSLDAMCKIILHNGHSVCHLPCSAVQLFLMLQKSIWSAFFPQFLSFHQIWFLFVLLLSRCAE